MKKVAYCVTMLCILLAVLAFSEEQGFCWNIGGHVFIDADDDGEFDVGETQINGVKVNISPNDLDGKNYDDDGYFTFHISAISPKNYTIEITLCDSDPYIFDNVQTALDKLVSTYSDHGYVSWNFEYGESSTSLVIKLTGAKFNYYDADIALLQAVPIPGAVWLLGSGLIGLVGIRRRYKKV